MRHNALIVQDKTTEVNFEVAGEFGSVEGYILINNSPAQRAGVTVRRLMDTGDEAQTLRVEPDGYYTAQNVSPGPISIEVYARSKNNIQRRTTTTIELLPNETIRQDFNFSEVATIRGMVQGIGPGEWAYVFVLSGRQTLKDLPYQELRQLGRAAVSTVDVNSVGRYNLDEIEPGTYTIVAVAQSGSPGARRTTGEPPRHSSKVVRVRGDQRITLNLKL